MSATLTGTIDDATFGSWSYARSPGLTEELVSIEFSNDVSASNVIPSRLNRLKGWVGHICATDGCVSGSQGKPITNMSLCEGPVLEISVGDVSAGVSTDRRLNYIAWGY